MDKGYQGTSIGFMTDKPTSTEAVQKSLSENFNALRTSSFISSITKPANSLTKIFSTAALCTAAVLANPQMIGAAVGDFERGRTEALTGQTHEQEASIATAAGAFAGEFERKYNQGAEQGLKAALKKPEPAQP